MAIDIDFNDPIFDKFKNGSEELSQEKLDEIGKILAERHNSLPVNDFEGYSPVQMQWLIYEPFGSGSPIKINPNIADHTLDKIYILPPLEYLILEIKNNSPFKLTQKGNIPPKYVKRITDIYAGEDEFFIKSLKLVKESDSFIAELLHLFLELSGIVKKRKNAWIITKNGQFIISNRTILLKTMLEILGLKLNRAYFDAFGDNDVGQIGFAFIFALIAKYGNNWKNTDFYAEKYFQAFPLLQGKIELSWSSASTDKENSNRCFKLRIFERFMLLFNLIEINKDTNNFIERNAEVKKSEIFDKIFTTIWN